MKKTIEMTSELAKELLGTNPAIDVIIRANFTAKDLGLDVKGRIKSYADACADQGITPLTLKAFSGLPSIDQVHAFASHRVTTIIRSLNEGWVPDWSDDNQRKYYVWYTYGSGVGFSCGDFSCDRASSAVGSRLHFKSEELARYFASQFITDVNEYFTI
jgi:hypothetical protein